ncbi:MAG: hypothetical protein HY289_15110 [Planctomycetes bacterium]|nr:hypothetical protein [Planctomycetota bacterium]
MKKGSYRRRSLSLGRRLLCDALYFARADYMAAAERTMRLADVSAARQEASPRPSWAAIITKAFALAARDHPEMRQVHLGFPWSHICEFETQAASVAVTRRVNDEDMVFLAPLVNPEEQSLQDLDARLRYYQETPVEEIRAFRDALRIARLPTLLRRLLWGISLWLLPRRRLKHFGTFCVTTMSPFGAKTITVPTLGSPILHYGAMTDAGEVPVGIAFDHRIMDGAVVGYTLLEMEQVLRHQITAELRSMKKAAFAA